MPEVGGTGPAVILEITMVANQSDGDLDWAHVSLSRLGFPRPVIAEPLAAHVKTRKKEGL
jgi:hypothetical protein